MLERILRLMEEQDINKNRLAALSNLPRTTIYSALLNEDNCRKTKLDTMRAIAAALNTNLDFIITGNDSQMVNGNFEPNTVIYIGRNGEQAIYEFNDSDALIVDAFLKKFKKN